VNIYTRKQRWKMFLLTAALLIGVCSLWYTNVLVNKLAEQEKVKAELWVKATRHLSDLSLSDASDQTFALDVLQSNTTIPVILADSKNNINASINLDTLNKDEGGLNFLRDQIAVMKKQHTPIEVKIDKDNTDYIYYKDSTILQQLRYYPYYQLAVISLFLLVSYLAFSSSRKAEQNQVWVGMAKETAHQLGTPLSSLVAWVEYLKTQNNKEEHLNEIQKDINRLQTITERFSKIGSAPTLKKENIAEVINNSILYIKSRVSSKVDFSLTSIPNHTHIIYVPINVPLFEWVLENIFKNAVDAIEGMGKISVLITDQQQFVYVDICDSGKGIPKSRFKTVFKPGYTSKKRGWGLGLSLSKRIIEEYHSGQIFVKSSEHNKGTVFRIVLNKV
jgi:K+-sensing histidine kinase KdpD